MYPKPKKSWGTWFLQIFLGVSVLILIGAIAFGIFISKDGGEGFRNLTSGGDGPFDLSQ